MRRRFADSLHPQRVALLAACVIAPLAGGCYNGQEMVERILQRIADDDLTEIELGTYQVTLPRPADDPVATSIRVEIVGAVDRRNARAVRRQLEEVQTQLRHATILALRQSQQTELLEPDLKSLRERVAAITAQHVTAAHLDSIAFRSYAVYED